MDNQKVEPPEMTIMALAWAAQRESGWTPEQHSRVDEYIKTQTALAQEQVRLPLAKQGRPGAMATGVNELFAYRLSKAAGVRVAPVTLRNWDDEPKASDGFIRKVPGGWCVSERIPQAIPIYYLRHLCKAIGMWHSPSLDTVLHDHWRESFAKPCPVSRAEYADFPDTPPDAVLAAATWNSPERVLTHAYRAFLHCSFGHTSNCLVDVEGRLWLIDHEKIIHAPDTSDIETLYAFVRNAPGVMRACRQISNITP
ncbi:MAG TPA: hypothetical protein VNO70_14795, partial [Blastocatellia bacterium]|nr:hypothetical protein [Blastocatellia bacterium]